MKNKFLLAAVATLALAAAAPASADVILFDADGSGGSADFEEIVGLEWQTGNGLAEANATTPVGETFQFYYQAELGSALLESGGDVDNGEAGVWYTLVIGFQESVSLRVGDPTDLTGNTALFFDFEEGGDNFFQIYANTSDPVTDLGLTGVCFVCGELILDGTVTGDDFSSLFNILEGSGIQDLDNTGDNDYPDVDSFVGSGSTLLKVKVNSYDTDYFQGLDGAIIDFAINDATQTIPFDTANPSACFFATAFGGTLMDPDCTSAAPGSDFFDTTGVSAQIGVGSIETCQFPVPGLQGNLINGCAGNTMLEVDGNSSFTTLQAQVPEPATLTLLGFGLLGSAAARRRQLRRKQQQ